MKKSNKVKLIIVITLYFVINILLVVFVFPSSWGYLTSRVRNMIGNNNIVSFFEVNTDFVSLFLKDVIKQVLESAKTFKFDFVAFSKSLNKFSSTLSIVANLLVVVFLLIFIFLSGVNLKTHNTKSSMIFVKIIKKIKGFILTNLCNIKKYKKNHKLLYFLWILIILMCSGVFPVFVFELVLFILRYLYHGFLKFDFHIYLFNFIKWVVYYIIKFFIWSPWQLDVIVFIVIIYNLAIALAKKKMRKNHEYTKKFVACLGQSTIINAPPSTGKTVSNVYFSLLAEELYIDELEENIFNFETANPSLNMGISRIKSAVDYDELNHTNKRLEDYFDYKKNTKDIENYKYIDFYAYDEVDDYFDDYFKLYQRGSFIVSSFGIYSPYYHDYVKQLDWDSIRFYRKQKNYRHEPYEVISLTELNKELNSHDDKKVIGEDGSYAFFELASHLTNRKCKIFADYQSTGQVPLRIKGAFENFIKIKSNKKKCYPLLLKLFVINPTKLVYRFFAFMVKTFDGKKENLGKGTYRKGITHYKRNDYTLFYSILRYCLYLSSTFLDYLDTYRFMKIKAKMGFDEEFTDSIKIKYYVNVCDLSYKHDQKYKLFDSTMFGGVYDDMKTSINDESGLKDMAKWTSLNGSLEDYQNIHMHFIEKWVGSQKDDTPTILESGDEVDDL